MSSRQESKPGDFAVFRGGKPHAKVARQSDITHTRHCPGSPKQLK
jgi:hypothetical protein